MGDEGNGHTTTTNNNNDEDKGLGRKNRPVGGRSGRMTHDYYRDVEAMVLNEIWQSLANSFTGPSTIVELNDQGIGAKIMLFRRRILTKL